ncbi:TonB family protein [Tenacibaculum adriaticum]|uniref:TonB family protein n=1 Tax=Tenacibaculum adriaticum TaxID=413713 RepID=A0A5S5DV08_9FLAO|nr:energy transducer TonB [Tenacibaculum adriaticum]TYP99773.1 TonB family protein [Tenacibaculum adriaticum]
MKKAYWLIGCLFFGSILTAQNKKATSNESEDSINSVAEYLNEEEEAEKTRLITLRASQSQRRFLKKRKIKRISTVNNHKISKTENPHKTVNISKTLSKNIEEEFTIEKFNTVDKIPLFKECKRINKENQQACFNHEMKEFINKNINYPKDAIHNKINGKISIKFIIDERGKVNNIQISGPRGSRSLKKEVMKLITKLPKFIPAEKKGKVIPVEYDFKLNFSL